MDVQDIKPNLMVHAKSIEGASHGGARGIHVGTVDHLDGGRFIKLKRSDSLDGRHHWVPVAWVIDVDDKAVYLSKTPEEFEREVLDENPALLH